MDNNYGFIRVGAASPRVKVADVSFNIEQIKTIVDRAETDDVSLLVFPELSVTGYTCGDLFSQSKLISAAEDAVLDLCAYTTGKYVTVVVGAPVLLHDRLYNCAIVLRDGQVFGIVPKLHIPAYHEFYEARWFGSGSAFREGVTEVVYAGARVPFGPSQLFTVGGVPFAVELCEDLWTPIPPSSYHAIAGARIIVNLSASNEAVMKHAYRKELVSSQSSRTVSAYIYASSGYGESTQDLVFAGSSLIYENGLMLAESPRFSMDGNLIEADVDAEKLSLLRRQQTTFFDRSALFADYTVSDIGEASPTDFEETLLRPVEPHPFAPDADPDDLAQRSEEITSMQVLGLVTRMQHIGSKKAVIGVSGGLDSTLALLVTALAFDRMGLPRDGIIGITMPGFGTTDRTYTNALGLMKALGISMREVSIVPAVKQHFEDIGHDATVHDVTYENSQARERTQILMDIANEKNGIVVGTGDLSELALGWCTYNGDHMSMYGVNAGVPKTLVRSLVRWAAVNRFEAGTEGERGAREILLDIVDTPISPELTPADSQGNIVQKTEDLVGPYELHDFFLYNFVRYGFSPEKILFLARKAFVPDYSEEEILKWLRKFCWRFFSQQFKRSCMPDGPKIGSVSLSPRGDWRMPSDASSSLWYSSLPE